MPAFRRFLLASLDEERIRGAAMHQGVLVTWGGRLRRWDPSYTRSETICAGSFGPAGCVGDFDGDGRPDIAVIEDGTLVWFRAPEWTRHAIGGGLETDEVVPARLHGRTGILLVHRRNQVRFYWPHADPARPWQSRDIYSFYSPSDQGGLLVTDVDSDGRPDIVCGNYWIRSPHEFDLPWRLFAINTWSEESLSGMARFALAGRSLIACQAAMAPARLARFGKPADPREMWKEQRLDGSLALACPGALSAAGDDFALSESGGQGRLILFRAQGPRGFIPEIVARGCPLVFLHYHGGSLLGVGSFSIIRWKA